MVIREKKEFLYEERDETTRELYSSELESIELEKIVYIDESGFDPNLKYEYGWSKISQKIKDDKKGKRSQRINIAAALNFDKKLFAPFVFEGYYTSEVFDCYVREILCPAIATGTTVVLDNASFHKFSNIKTILAEKNCKVLFSASLFSRLESY